MFRSNATQLLLAKSVKEGRRITQKEVAEATGLMPSTLVLWFSDKLIGQVKARAVAALCQYFECTMNDLLTIVRDEESSEAKTPLPAAS